MLFRTVFAFPNASNKGLLLRMISLTCCTRGPPPDTYNLPKHKTIIKQLVSSKHSKISTITTARYYIKTIFVNSYKAFQAVSTELELSNQIQISSIGICQETI